MDDIAQLPYGGEHVWNWFVDIFNPGGVGMGPYRPLFLEIEAYSRAINQRILGWEALAIRKLAEEYIIYDSKRDKSAPAQRLSSVVDTGDAKAVGDFWRRIAQKPLPAKPPTKKTS